MDYAFPSDDDHCTIEQGMELRDYFAAKAMAAEIGAPIGSQNHTSTPRVAAEWAYEFADAMMFAREKK